MFMVAKRDGGEKTLRKRLEKVSEEDGEAGPGRLIPIRQTLLDGRL